MNIILAIILFVICVALAAVFLLGPRVSIDASFRVPSLPDDLDNYLAESESAFSDITPGAEKKIIWASAQRTQTEYAFVYLHGFSATRQESAPVPDNIASHFNSNIYYARLAGNGRSADAMLDGSVNRWVNDAAEAMAIASKIGKRTVIIGCSTGATLAWWTANQPALSNDIAAMVFLSPNFGVADSRANLLLCPWGAQLARKVEGEYRESTPVSDAHGAYWTCRYPTTALLPMMGLVRLIRDYPATECKVPVHITWSKHDDTVSVKNIAAFYAALPQPKAGVELVQPEGASQHVIVGDILAPENNTRVTDSVIDFLSAHLSR